jgi:ABC-2 type transport system permease protein
MKKIILIGWKDLTLAFRDRAALIMMLVAPFALTLGLGFVTGRFSGSSNSGISDIPVAIVNQDGGQLGNALVDLFQSKDLAGLVKPVLVTDPILAQGQVDADQAAAAVIIPAGFSQSILPAQGEAASSAPVQIKLYTNPTRPTSVGVVKTILDEFISHLEVGRVSGQVAVTQLLGHRLIQAQDAARVGTTIGVQQADAVGANTSIMLKSVTNSGSG